MTAIAPSFLIGSSLFLHVTRTTLKSSMCSKFGRIRPRTCEVAALEHLEKSPYTCNGGNVVTTLVPSFCDGSSSFLEATIPTIKDWMSLTLIPLDPITELAALEGRKNQ